MLDFLIISTKRPKKDLVQIYPKFVIKKPSDLMIRGGDFYAIWVDERKLWSTDEQDALQLIDREVKEAYEAYQKDNPGEIVQPLYMWDATSGMIDSWHKYCQKQMRDSFVPLDEKLIFSNTETTKKDYATKKLPYPLETGDISSWDRLMSVLYSPEERTKIEWAIGSIVAGDSKTIQKFLVLYGAAGTGKSTVLNIIQQLFDGYYSVFDAKALGSSSNSFALEAFKSNPLVAIQHDGDLSRIEDNTRLNSLVSHELMTVNEKFKSTYSNRFNAFLFMGTNKPVKITDGKSGLLRRLIDVSPTGDKLNSKEYKTIMKRIDFELGAIANHCLEVYKEDPNRYENYIPMTMLGASNDFYNFVLDSYHIFKKEDGTSLKAAWEMYKTYCDEAKVPYPSSQRIFKEELKNYFREYKDRVGLEDGTRVRSYFSGFRYEKFDDSMMTIAEEKEPEKRQIIFTEQSSAFDKECADCLAQYANDEGTPLKKWERVRTKLSSIDTSQLHYVRLPENHIVIDFDIPDKDGNKDFERNLSEASKWPPTYAELSKSGAGIHLHYIYTGDPSKLSRIYDDHVEIKVFTGKSSLRRKLTKCNDLPIAKISSGLPLKGEDTMVNAEAIKSEKGLRTLIKRNLNKEIHPNTKPSIDFIYKILEDAYASGLAYDITDMRNAVLAFAASSTHQSDYCVKLVNKMMFKSENASETVQSKDEKLVFYDVEVFPNLFLVNWKIEGEGKPVVRMINPTPNEIEDLMQLRLVGFNCRRYDNHILYARLMGYTNEQLYKLSQRIINGSKNAMFGEAYNVSYTDVYDFCSKKQSLKKWEIELGIHHKELGLPWDQPVPEDQWIKVAEYCDNDVLATEAVFNARKADFVAREILADVAGGTVNDTTNSLTTKIIFGNNRKPQEQFNYRNMGEVTDDCDSVVTSEDGTIFANFGNTEYTKFDSKGRPVFPGYIYEMGKSTYRGEEVGEGGYVYAEPGMYTNIALLDISSMHPSSIIAEELFGKEYTKRFREIRDARVEIKHKNFDKARKMLGGKLSKYLTDESTASDLAQALKIAINSVYGLTAAKFDNAFRDVRNKDNIVAKRGALFMINLKHEVQDRGFTVAHIKTDSIKIPNATPEIIKFVMDYGKQYGYIFEHEATYDRMCLVNDAVYIAKYPEKHDFKLTTGEKLSTEWTATGAQFQVPYVFKKLFTKDSIKFEDLCESRNVSTALYLDMNEGLTTQPDAEKELAARIKKGLSAEKELESGYIGFIDPTFKNTTFSELEKIVENGHNYIFVGKVGLFCPIKKGCGGGLLMRENHGKFVSAPSSKGYRWLESEMVKNLEKEDDIDQSYYEKLANAAIDTINEYGDYYWFAS